MDFTQRFELPEAVRRERRRFFFRCSSLGNFTPDEAQQFLRKRGVGRR